MDMGSKYGHLTPYERGQIEALRRHGVSNRMIAQQLQRDRKTIDREIRRNTEAGAYIAEKAESRAAERQSTRSRRRLKCTPQVLRQIKRRLSYGQSPDVIAGRCRRLGIAMLSCEGIYQWIYAEAASGGRTFTRMVSPRRKRRPRKRSRDLRGRIPNRVSISERPKPAANRARLGDWEGDTIVGAGGKSAIASLVDRRSRMTLLMPLPNRSAQSTSEAIIQRLSKEVFETLTLDNGKEFSDHLRIARELRGKVYFCDPYSPWQRPSNENSNRITRRTFPKGTDFRKVTKAEIDIAEHILNNRPRKILGYATPWEIYSGKAKLPEGGAL